MADQPTTNRSALPAQALAGRAAWQRPDLRRTKAGAAELATGPVGDGPFQTS
jgi:predicted transcriptional regulator